MRIRTIATAAAILSFSTPLLAADMTVTFRDSGPGGTLPASRLAAKLRRAATRALLSPGPKAQSEPAPTRLR
ncbi:MULTISPECIES: hypothetical protein [Rhizobium]|uniref:hypothetical protein n=1 Tax=Rhizobium TaxID=379 RepID=UPI0032B12F2C